MRPDPDDAGVPSGEARSTLALLASLTSAAAEHQVWRERLNGRWICFLRHAGRTYCLLPLEYGPLPERAAPVAPGQETERRDL